MSEDALSGDELEALYARLAVFEQAQAIAHMGTWRARMGPEAELMLSPEAARILGVDEGAPIRNVDFFNTVHPRDRVGFLEAITRVREQGARCDVSVRIVRSDETERAVVIVVGPGSSDLGPGSLIGTIQEASYRRLEEHGTERTTAERELRSALIDHQLFLEYQPIVSLATGEFIGAEALVRWEHPRRGRLEPDEFVAFAEESGLIVPLGLWVLERACQELRRWRDAGVPDGFTLAINLSAAQLWHDKFANELERAIEEAGIPWTAIVLEVTESILVEGALEATLREVRDRGAHIAVDDFGTKYSALGYLPRLPIDRLKIDASFVSAIDEGSGRAVVAAIAALGQTLGLAVTAEGVETEAQLAAVRATGCHAAQGYLISRPLHGDSCLQLVLSGAFRDGEFESTSE